MPGLRTFLFGCALGLGLLAPGQAEVPRPPPLLLANHDARHIDPGLYLVSEKLDGVRALWDGGTLRFRSGRTVPAPAWFLQHLPPEPLDGELWMGRRRFDELSGTVRSDPPDDAAWRQVSYQVFELPGAAGSFEQRAAAIERLVARVGWPALRAVPQGRVRDRAALQQLLDDTVRGGGEGLMLHLADAPYTTGRSDVLIKLKPQHDIEARVVGHRPGKGKYEGLLGALEVETPAGQRFLLGTGFSDAERAAPPPIGSIVTYRFRELTAKGLPRFASFLRLRQEP